METRQIGRSGLTSSELAFGCWELGGTFGHIDQSEAVTAIHRAIDLGITLFDTAHIYGFDRGLKNWGGGGRSEAILSEALGSQRSKVQIVTKGGVPTRPDQNFPRDGRRAEILKDAEESLRALGTDYVDLYLLHWPDKTVALEESMGALNELVETGKARYVGVSNFPSALLREAADLAPIVANQVGYNLFDRRWEREMFATARELGVGIMGYGPLAHGLLTGAFHLDMAWEATDWRRGGMVFGQALFAESNFEANLAVVDQLRAIAQRKGITLASLALAWVLTQPDIAIGIVGARNAQEIEENVAATHVELTPTELAEIDEIMNGAAGQVDALPE